MAGRKVNDGLAVIGLPEIEEKMKGFSERLRKKSLRPALYAGAVVIRDEARRRVPVRYGALKRKIVAKSSAPDPRGKEIVASVGIARGKYRVESKIVTKKLAGGLVESKTKHRLRVVKGKAISEEIIVSPRRYAHLVELGTSHSAPEPFLRPAAESTKPAVMKAVSDRMTVEVRKEASR